MNLSPSYCSSASRPPPPQQSMPMSMPYPFYPPPHMYLTQPPWPTGPLPVPSTSQPVGPSQNPIEPSKYVTGPAISTWLQYLDSHPHRHCNYNGFVTLAPNFEAECYRTIDQLTSGSTSTEKLSSWVKIGKGTADYIIQYADEDMALVIDGKFEMESDQANVDETGDWM